jgi:hypothetical protein
MRQEIQESLDHFELDSRVVYGQFYGLAEHAYRCLEEKGEEEVEC